jgi:hypothetical protein
VSRHYKKPPVRPEVARKWLERHEVDGESPPQIAKADGYDVRTVRKQLDLMRREREIREARLQVLRGAVEKHYADLCSFAEKLKGGVSGNEPASIAPMLEENPLGQALRQHLPRITLWRNVDKLHKLVPDFEETVKLLRERIKAEALSATSMKFTSSAGEVGLYDAFVEGLMFHLKALTRDWQGLKGIPPELTTTEDGARVSRGAFVLALAQEDKADNVNKLFDVMMNEASGWDEYLRLKKNTDDFLRYKRAIENELTTIILRRIVPGKCLYCPI